MLRDYLSNIYIVVVATKNMVRVGGQRSHLTVCPENVLCRGCRTIGRGVLAELGAEHAKRCLESCEYSLHTEHIFGIWRSILEK